MTTTTVTADLRRAVRDTRNAVEALPPNHPDRTNLLLRLQRIEGALESAVWDET